MPLVFSCFLVRPPLGSATVSASSEGSVKTELASIAIQPILSDVANWKNLRSQGWLFVQQALAQQLVVLASPWLIVK